MSTSTKLNNLLTDCNTGQHRHIQYFHFLKKMAKSIERKLPLTYH